MSVTFDRLEKLIEDSFEEDVKLIARAVFAKVSGGFNIVEAEKNFGTGLAKIMEVREKNLATAKALVGR